jgi:hypothetical protein
MRLPFWHSHKTPILFMHLPKCGGTSISRAIGGKRVLSGLDSTLLGDFCDYRSMAQRTQERLYLGPLTAGAFDFVHGHFAMSTLLEAFPRGRLMTVLREPHARARSNFRYAELLPPDKLEKLGTYAERLARHRGRPSFFEAPELASITDNVFARFLLAPDHPDIPPGRFIDTRAHEAVYQAAAARLKRFAFLATLEDPALETKLSDFVGRALQLERRNVTRDHAGVEVPGRLVAIDERLWQVARSS